MNTPFTQLPKTAVPSVQLPALQAACARFVTLDGMPRQGCLRRLQFGRVRGAGQEAAPCWS